jgi:hypothetical protein
MSSKMWVMASYIRDNGTKNQDKRMVSVFSFGLMVQNMRGCGKMMLLVVKVE